MNIFDKTYKLIIMDNTIHVINYMYINSIYNNSINIKLHNKTLIIKGDNLSIKQMDEKELLIVGLIKGIDIIEN